MLPEQELAYLLEHRKYVSERIKILRYILKNGELTGTSKVNKDEVAYYTWCKSIDLIPYLNTWLNSDDNNSISALAIKAKVSDKTIRTILKEECEWSREDVVDRLFSAMGIPHRFNDIGFVRMRRGLVQVPDVAEITHEIEESLEQLTGY
jgi:hypothetical protein